MSRKATEPPVFSRCHVHSFGSHGLSAILQPNQVSVYTRVSAFPCGVVIRSNFTNFRRLFPMLALSLLNIKPYSNQSASSMGRRRRIILFFVTRKRNRHSCDDGTQGGGVGEPALRGKKEASLLMMMS